jgi:hypothetical protein
MRRSAIRGESRGAVGSMALALAPPAAAFAVAGCGGGSPSKGTDTGTGKAKPGGTLSVGYYHDAFWDSIDPNLWYGLTTWEVGRQTPIWPEYGGTGVWDLESIRLPNQQRPVQLPDVHHHDW